MLALSQVEAESCIGCGYHPTLTSDRSNVFMPEEVVCPVCAGADVYQRVQGARDDEFERGLGKKPPPKKQRPKDGRTTNMRPVDPDEVKQQADGRVATRG